MLKKIMQVTLILTIIIITAACGTSQGNHQDAKETALNFLVEKEWNEGVKEESWQDAEVSEIIVNNDYFLLDESYRGEKVLSVAFEEKENLVVGIPLVIVSLDTNEVVGYMPSE